MLSLHRQETQDPSSSKRSLDDVHRYIWWLEVFCEVNYIATLRLMDKLDSSADIQKLLEKQEFMKFGKELEKMREDLYSKVAYEFFDNDKPEAIQFITKTSKHYRNDDIAWIFLSLGVSVMCLVLSAILWFLSDKNMFGEIFISFSVFRFTLAINLILFSTA